MNFINKFFPKKTPKVQVTDLTKRFDLLNRMGQGTMSKVWKARDTQSGKLVALKVLDKEQAKKLAAKFPNLERPKEGEVAMSLDHKNIVKTYEHGITTNSEQFLVMELIEGTSLNLFIDRQGDVMKQNRMMWLLQIGDAIEYMHSNQWIHRDLCPHNVVIDNNNNVKLIDFGLTVPNTPTFRAPGNRTGKATYMAPELMKRLPTDQRLDVFSYAITCYECFTGRLPWKSGDSMKEVIKSISSPPVEISKLVPEIDEKIASTIMRGIERDPKSRWKSIQAMTERFRN